MHIVWFVLNTMRSVKSIGLRISSCCKYICVEWGHTALWSHDQHRTNIRRHPYQKRTTSYCWRPISQAFTSLWCKSCGTTCCMNEPIRPLLCPCWPNQATIMHMSRQLSCWAVVSCAQIIVTWSEKCRSHHSKTHSRYHHWSMSSQPFLWHGSHMCLELRQLDYTCYWPLYVTSPLLMYRIKLPATQVVCIATTGVNKAWCSE